MRQPAMRDRIELSTMLSTAACLLLVAGLSGCGNSQPEGTVLGTVTFEDKPVTDARIQLQAQETGTAVAAELDSEGRYRIEQPVAAGTYVVTVNPIDNAPIAGEEPAGSEPTQRTDIPERYRAPATSGLTTTIAEGENTYDVQLKAEE